MEILCKNSGYTLYRDVFLDTGELYYGFDRDEYIGAAWGPPLGQFGTVDELLGTLKTYRRLDELANEKYGLSVPIYEPAFIEKLEEIRRG